MREKKNIMSNSGCHFCVHYVGESSCNEPNVTGWKKSYLDGKNKTIYGDCSVLNDNCECMLFQEVSVRFKLVKR